ncbi:MAG TPA: hypothetical protein PL143_18355 [Rhodocyclaceae bacterium]|nr:hypothetical protein [Rhodocyclaceae bacterium]
MASKSILPVIRRAQRGDADAQHRLGCLYLEGGEGLAANERTAYLWLSRAATQGKEAAWRAIGEHITPQGADGDPQLAHWYRLAAAAGSPHAKRRLARTLIGDDDCRATHETRSAAIALLQDAAAAGDAEACRDLGRLLLTSPVEPADVDTACRLLEQAFEAGLREVAPDLADHYWKTRALALALKWYERCPDPADAEQIYRLGLLRALRGEPANKLLEQAADDGHVGACEELGIRLATGSAEHRRDLKKAVRWLEPAAAQGSSRAAYLLATIYRHRASGAYDNRRAHGWLFQAARLGHGQACLRAGKAILRRLDAGRSTPGYDTIEAPEATATEFLIAAARQGFNQASDELARMLRPLSPGFLNHASAWSRFIELAERKDPSIGARVKLGYALGLSARELLAVVPDQCDFGNYFIITVAGRRPLRRRIVLIETERQRQLLDEAKTLLRRLPVQQRDDAAPAEFRSTYLKLRLLSRQFGHAQIDAALFPRSRPSTPARTSRAQHSHTTTGVPPVRRPYWPEPARPLPRRPGRLLTDP